MVVCLHAEPGFRSIVLSACPGSPARLAHLFVTGVFASQTHVEVCQVSWEAIVPVRTQLPAFELIRVRQVSFLHVWQLETRSRWGVAEGPSPVELAWKEASVEVTAFGNAQARAQGQCACVHALVIPLLLAVQVV